MTVKSFHLSVLFVLLATVSAFGQQQQLRYSTYLGPQRNSTPARPAVATAPDGSVYVAFAEDHLVESSFDVRVMKFDASRALSYSVRIGGVKEESPASIAVAADGSVWVAGSTLSADFPLVNPIFSANPTNNAAFLFRLGPGGTLTFSTFFATPGGSRGAKVIADRDGSAVWSGWTFGPSLPVTPGVFQPAYRGLNEGFIARVSATGALLTATYLGGGGRDYPRALAFGPDGDIYVGGDTTSVDLLTSSGAFQPGAGKRACLEAYFHGKFDSTIAVACTDGFVGRFSADLTQRRYLTYLRETDPSTTSPVTFDVVDALAVGPTGDAYATGYTRSANLFPTTPGAVRTTCLGLLCSESPTVVAGARGDVFVTRLNGTGTAPVYSTFLGGSYPGQTAQAIAVDATGRAYVGGTTSALDFPIVNGFQSSRQGNFDGFLTRLNASGSAIEYSTHFGGSLVPDYEAAINDVTDLVLGPGNTVWLSGWTGAPDFPTTPDAWLRVKGSGTVPFLTALSLPEPLVSFDLPAAGVVTGAFEVGGWAIDRGAWSDAGIDAVHVYAYPNPGSGAAPIFLGASPLGFARPDVAAAFGPQFAAAGWLMDVDPLPADSYMLVAFAHSELTGSFGAVATRTITIVVTSQPLLSVDSPAPGAVVTSGTRVFVGGWAIDQGAPLGTGIDAIHVWIYPNGGNGTPFFAGVANYGVSRPDVGAAFGSRFTQSGYELDVSGLAPGTYLIAVFGHSTVTNSFVVMHTRAVTIQ